MMSLQDQVIFKLSNSRFVTSLEKCLDSNKFEEPRCGGTKKKQMANEIDTNSQDSECDVYNEGTSEKILFLNSYPMFLQFSRRKIRKSNP